MAPVNVITSRDFTRQNLTNGNLAKEVENPTDGVDPSIEAVLAQEGIMEFFISFDSVTVLSRQRRGYPNPTLNHFCLSKYLRDTGKSTKKFLDLGCGVGFMGNYASVHLNPEEIVFADLNPNAVGQSVFSYGLNHELDINDIPRESRAPGAMDIKAPKHTLCTRIGDAAQSLRGYDAEGGIAVAAPMYIPGVCEVFPQAFKLFAFVAKNTGATLYIGHTNLASGLVDDAAKSMGLKLSLRAEREVPFVVEYSNMDAVPGLIDHLASKGLEIRDKMAFHKLMVSELSR